MSIPPRVLPTNDAIFLHFLSHRPSLGTGELHNVYLALSSDAKEIASKIGGNKNLKYRKPIPPCTDPVRYKTAAEAIDRILGAIPSWQGGAEAVLGYMRYAGVLNLRGGFRKSN